MFTKRTRRKGFLLLVLIAGIGTMAFHLDYFEINKQLNIFSKVYKEVNISYVDETKPAELMETAIDEMLRKLDPYTVYIPEEDVEDFRITQTGDYGGIGATIRQIGDFVAVDMPYKGFAADKAGLIAGDLIISIDGKGMKGATPEDVTNLLKGTPGTNVDMVIRRYGEEQKVQLKREEIHVSSVPYYGMIDENVGYVRLRSFTETAGREVSAAIQDLRENHNMKALIFDLKSNPGGLLREAVHISNLFIPKGQLVVSTRGRDKSQDHEYRTLMSPLVEDLPLAILVDEHSASASEIVAGTIQDMDRGIIVGRRSFGKGLVQQSRPLDYGAQIKITVAKYYTPSGRCIQAIDYGNRNENGEVNKLPDSLRTAFKTQNGRTVYDGGGIDPDIKVDDKKISPIVYSLAINGHLFEFATKYVQSHPTAHDPSKFALSDTDYNEFVTFLEGKDYPYETDTEYAIKYLQDAAEQESYDGTLGAEIKRLEDLYLNQKKDDLITFKNQIKKYLEREIVGRYFYEEGQIQYMLNDNPAIEAAIRTLTDTEKYARTLAPAN